MRENLKFQVCRACPEGRVPYKEKLIAEFFPQLTF